MYAAYTYPEELKTIRALAAIARQAAVSRKSGTAPRIDWGPRAANSHRPLPASNGRRCGRRPPVRRL